MEKLLTEQLDPNVAKLQESKTDGKSWYLEGIFMQSEAKNGNGRIYPKSVLTEAVNNINSKMKKGYILQ
jgi:hypothetical protein